MTQQSPSATAGRTGIAPRLTAVTVLIMSVSALLVGLLVFSSTNHLLVAEEKRNLEQSAEAIGQRLLNDMAELRSTVQLLGGTPPIDGIIRARNHDGWDAQGNSSEAVWAQRLATIFSVTLASRPAYVQARYIGVADGGRELVRVDAADGAIRRVADADLQRKGERAYFLDTTRLRPGQVHLSAIDLNREHGRIAEPRQPTLRAATPIFDGDRLFGMVVVNVDFDRLIEGLRQRLPTPGTRLYLTNAAGDYIAHPQRSKTFAFEFGQRQRLQDDLPSLAGHFGTRQGPPGAAPRDEPSDDARDLIRFTKVAHDPLRPEAFIGVLLRAPYDEVVHGATRLQQRLILLSLGLILVAALVTVVFVRRQLRPLQMLTRTVEQGLDAGTDFTVPPGANREAQVLAQALTRMSRQVEERSNALRAANREMEAFSYTVSHDLRGPLRAINGYAALLQEELAERLGEDDLDALAHIREASVRMNQLIDGLLQLSRMQRREMRCVRVDLSAQVHGLIAELQAAEPERTVQWSVEPGLSTMGDPTLLRAMLQNLLGNAWKYTLRCDPARIAFGREVHDGHEVFYLRDNGAGFDTAHVGKLFQPFSRLHADSDYPGTGIGLATVQRIVQRHGGRVWAEGEVGRGASFFFELGTPEAATA